MKDPTIDIARNKRKAEAKHAIERLVLLGREFWYSDVTSMATEYQLSCSEINNMIQSALKANESKPLKDREQ